MQRILNLGFLAICLIAFVGCDSSNQGGLATDSGTMTIEEFERLQAEADGTDESKQATESSQ